MVSWDFDGFLSSLFEAMLRVPGLVFKYGWFNTIGLMKFMLFVLVLLLGGRDVGQFIRVSWKCVAL